MFPFENELFRFGLCGTSIAVYGVVDVLARRRVGNPAPKRSLGLKLVFTVSLLSFYLLIAPTGGPLLGGAVNLAGIGVLAAAMVLRAHASGVPGSREHRNDPGARTRPLDLVPRMLFYLALPAAVGVPWGWLVLTLPAWAASLYPFLAPQGRPAASLEE